MNSESVNQIDEFGYAILPGLFDDDWIRQTIALIEDSLTNDVSDEDNNGVRKRAGAIYAARNVLDLAPELAIRWRTPFLESFLTAVLGDDFGLVRGLFFDKPPSQTWALPWHKDMSIAVKADSVSDRAMQFGGYSRPRLKAGVPHCEPPENVLASMLTLRIHLDAMTAENGPLEVLPGSHATGKDLEIDQFEPHAILTNRGDVLAMRPLLVHASGSSVESTDQHRRVLHLEFSGLRHLPGGVLWDRFE